jgi:hypothetical protein
MNRHDRERNSAAAFSKLSPSRDRAGKSEAAA